MKNVIIVFLLMFSLSFTGCAGLTKVVNKADTLTTAITDQWDATKGLYISIRNYVIANKEELNIPNSLWEEMVAMDKQLKEMDIVIEKIKLVKAISKEQAANFKATANAMANIVKLTLAVI